jgi:hypothetical protein
MAELLILLAILAGAIWLDHAIQVRSRSSAPSSHDSPLPPAAGDYLRSVETELDLPAGDRDSVRAELADHLADSIAAITAEGLDADRATREALARLGNPGELARSINAAHRSTRRLLAGAAGGVFEAGFGAVYGYVVAFLIMAIVAIVAGTALRPVLDAVSKALPGVSAAVADPAVFGAVLWGAAFMAGRRSVQTLTRASRRGWGEVGRWWALAGFAPGFCSSS